MWKCCRSQCSPFPSRPNWLDLHSAQWLSCDAAKENPHWKPHSEVWCHTPTPAHFLHQGKIEDSAGGADDLSEQEAPPLLHEAVSEGNARRRPLGGCEQCGVTELPPEPVTPPSGLWPALTLSGWHNLLSVSWDVCITLDVH